MMLYTRHHRPNGSWLSQLLKVFGANFSESSEQTLIRMMSPLLEVATRAEVRGAIHQQVQEADALQEDPSARHPIGFIGFIGFNDNGQGKPRTISCG